MTDASMFQKAALLADRARRGLEIDRKIAEEVGSDYMRLVAREDALTRALDALKLHADNRRDGRLDRAAVFEYAISIGWPEVVGSQAATAKHFNVTPAAISYILKPKRRAMGEAKVDDEDRPPV